MYRFIQHILASFWAVLAVFWLALFLLYLPTVHSGWVSDTLGWLDAVRHQSFADYINRQHTGLPTLYQTTQFITWTLYQVFGANQWAWHIIHISLHAVNCTLLYFLCRGLLSDSCISAAAEVAFAAAALCCISPYVTEVIVWEASFHYLQGLLFILTIILLLRRFLHEPRPRYAIAAFLLFLFSAFSLEVFYLTPLFCLSLIAYYRLVLKYGPAAIRRSILSFVLPQLLLFIAHLVMVRALFGTTTARLGDSYLHLPITYYAIRPPDYLFHLLGGRFLPQAFRSGWHAFFCTYLGAGLFYSLALSVLAFLVLRFKSFGSKGQLAVLFLCWHLLSMGLVMPLWFPERLLIIGDRYLYILLPPFFMLMAVLVSGIRQRVVRRTIFFLACILSVSLTCWLNNTWKVAAQITDALERSIPLNATKTTILLNNPASLNGAPMIGAAPDEEFRLMHNLLYRHPIVQSLPEGYAYNMVSPYDGATVTVLDDSTIRVSLSSTAPQWYYGTDIAHSYSNSFFTASLTHDPCCYILHLKQDPASYQLLYQKGTVWYKVRLR